MTTKVGAVGVGACSFCGWVPAWVATAGSRLDLFSGLALPPYHFEVYQSRKGTLEGLLYALGEPRISGIPGVLAERQVCPLRGMAGAV
jgi:hypothetical protein